MARYRRSDQIEVRIADDLEALNGSWTVDLIAKKATGVEGYRLTLSYLAVEGSDAEFVHLEPADDRPEVEERAEALAADPDHLRDLLHAKRD
jgi:hypothetical protein